MYFSCVSIRWLSSWVCYIRWIWSEGSPNWTDFTFGRGQAIFAWGGPVFGVYICFYWIPLDMIHVCGCCGGVVLWVPFHIFTMVLWRGNSIGFNHVPLTGPSHLCCWVHIQDSFFQVWDWRCPGYLEGYGLILLTRISVLMLLVSVYVMILLFSVAVLVLLNGIFFGVLTLIWSILMAECISKVPVDNGFNHWMGWIHIKVWCL